MRTQANSLERGIKRGESRNSRRPPKRAAVAFFCAPCGCEGRGALRWGSSLRGAVADRDLGGLRGSVSDVREGDLVPGSLAGHRGGQVVGALNRLTCETGDHVAGLQPGAGSRRAALDLRNLGSSSVRRRPDEHAEIRMLDGLAAVELGGDRGHGVGGNREADALVAVGVALSLCNADYYMIGKF